MWVNSEKQHRQQFPTDEPDRWNPPSVRPINPGQFQFQPCGWGAVIGAVISAVGAYMAQKKAAKAQNAAAAGQEGLVGLQSDAAKQLMPYGMSTLQQGVTALAPVIEQYHRMVGGDRNALLESINPQLSDIASSYDRPLQYMTESAPRTAATSGQRLGMLSARADAMNKATIGARNSALSGLAGLGGQLSNMGLGALGASFGGLQGAAASNNALMSQLFNLRNQNDQSSADMGGAVTDLITQLMQRRDTNNSSGGGGGGSSSGGNSDVIDNSLF